MQYTATADRGAGPLWALQCVEHPGAVSETRDLADAQRLMRLAIAFVAEVPEADVDVKLLRNDA